MIGNFQDGSLPGKMQFGSGWWYLDQKDGIEWQIDALSNVGLLAHFVGMLTDSRSFMSYPRHEYFRRVLCNLLGRGDGARRAARRRGAGRRDGRGHLLQQRAAVSGVKTLVNLRLSAKSWSRGRRPCCRRRARLRSADESLPRGLSTISPAYTGIQQRKETRGDRWQTMTALPEISAPARRSTSAARIASWSSGCGGRRKPMRPATRWKRRPAFTTRRRCRSWRRWGSRRRRWACCRWCRSSRWRWAEGGVSDEERALIVQFARERGIQSGSVADQQLSLWLRERPAEDVFARATRLIRALLDHPDGQGHTLTAGGSDSPMRGDRGGVRWHSRIREDFRGGARAARPHPGRARKSAEPAAGRRARRGPGGPIRVRLGPDGRLANPPPSGAPSDTLKAVAAGRGKLVGTAVQAGFLSDPQYNAVAGREFNYLTAEYR